MLPHPCQMSLLMQTMLKKLQQLCSIASNIKTAIVNVLWGEAACLQFEARGTDLERQQQGGRHI